MQARPTTVAESRRQLAARVASGLLIHFRPELPRLPTGELYKQGLRDEYRKVMA
jgi:hypothetical protein